MNRTAIVQAIVTNIRRGFFFGFFFLFLTTLGIAKDLNIQITGIDTHLTHLAGNYYLFLDILDDQSQNVPSLSANNIAFKIDRKPSLFSDFLHQDQVMERNIALLANLDHNADSKLFPTIKESFITFSQSKNETDSIFAGISQVTNTGDFIGDLEDLQKRIRKMKFNSENSNSFEDFLTVPLLSFPYSGKRNWLILIVSGNSIQQVSPAYEAKIRHMLASRHISLVTVFIGSVQSDSWLKRITTSENGRFYTVEAIEAIPELLQDLIKRIQNEYVLVYSQSALGAIPHQIEITVHNKEYNQTVQYHVKHKGIVNFEKAATFPFLLIAAVLISLGLGFLYNRNVRFSKVPNQPGFYVVTPGEHPQLISLEEKPYTLDFLSSIKTEANLRLSANLGKVTLTPEQHSFFLEDKNYKNALLINRRRVRRTLLKNGDILDVGELTLLYVNHNESLPLYEEDELEESIPITMNFDKPRGPIRRGIGMLVNEATKQEYYLVKNVTFLGRSKTNSIVLESLNIAPRHAKIMRIGGQYKLQDLSIQEGSFVNRRRVEQRFLKDGDEISFDTCRLRFRTVVNLKLDKSKIAIRSYENSK